MRKFLFLFMLLAASGVFGPTAKEAAAQCTHFAASGACPPEIPDGSTSTSVNADGTINWDSGGVSGPCCASPAGTETGAGLLNLNNRLEGAFDNPGSRSPFGTQSGSDPLPRPAVLDSDGNVVIPARGWPDNSCSGGDCTIGPGAALFGPGTTSGYQCDAGGPGCGDDIWVGLPQPGFGECGPGGCTGGAPVLPINVANLSGTGRYAQNRTTGEVDPFGGGLDFFMDPATGDITDLPEDRSKWPERIKLADRLNTAYVNGEIGYPFGNPDWDERSVQFYKDNPVEAPVTPPTVGVTPTFFYQTEDRGTTPVVSPSVFLVPQFISPYQQNRTSGGDIDPFGGGANTFVDPRTGESTQLPENEEEWPEKFKKAERLNSLYVSGHISYPFNDPDWETKPDNEFAANSGTGNTINPSVITTGGGLYSTGVVPDGRITVYAIQPGDNLFRIALRHGVSVDDLRAANGIEDGTQVYAGQVLTIPTSTAVPTTISTTSGQTDETGSAQTPTSSGRGAKFSDKAGRFGIGADTSLGGVGGLSARFQVAKNFGVQAIVSFTRVNLDSKNPNADLTNYVNAAVSNIAPPTTPPQVTPKPAQPTVTNLQKENFTADSRAPQIDQLDREGGETTYRVMFQGQIGPTGDPRTAEFDTRAAANRFGNMMKFEGMSFEDAAAAMPDDMKPTLAGTPATDLVETLTTRVPAEFRAPTLTDRWDGEIHDIYVNDPATGKRQWFDNREHAEIFLGALRGGASWSEAQQIDLEATRVARNNGVVATSPDGLASATVRGATTPSTPAPAGSVPTVINTRPAIIVRPGTPAGTNAGGGTPTVTNTPAPAGSAPTVVNNRPAIIVGAGTDAFKLEPRRDASGRAIEPFVRPDSNTGFAVQDPTGTGRSVGFIFEEQAEAMVMALRRGATWEQAEKTGFETAPTIVSPNAPPAGSAPVVTNQRPAVIVGAGTEAFKLEPRVDASGRAIEPFVRPDINSGFAVQDPTGTGRSVGFIFEEQAEAMVMALRRGATWEQAEKTGREASVGPIVTNTPPPGQAVVTNTPPPGQAVVTNNPPPGQAVVTAITPPPTRPEGQSAGFMTTGLQGQAYRVEIIKTPDGRTLAVGTGDNANHVFGEVKETTVKIFGDWRREGPWKPPPAPTPPNRRTISSDAVFNPGDKIKVEVDTQTTDPAGNTVDSGDDTPTVESVTANQDNLRIRSQIANSDRDHMTQQFFTDGFESGNTVQWTRTGY